MKDSINRILGELKLAENYLKEGSMPDQDLDAAKNIYRNQLSNEENLKILNQEIGQDLQINEIFENAVKLGIVLFDANSGIYKYQEEERARGCFVKVIIAHPMQQQSQKRDSCNMS